MEKRKAVDIPSTGSTSRTTNTTTTTATRASKVPKSNHAREDATTLERVQPPLGELISIEIGPWHKTTTTKLDYSPWNLFTCAREEVRDFELGKWKEIRSTVMVQQGSPVDDDAQSPAEEEHHHHVPTDESEEPAELEQAPAMDKSDVQLLLQRQLEMALQGLREERAQNAADLERTYRWACCLQELGRFASVPELLEESLQGWEPLLEGGYEVESVHAHLTDTLLALCWQAHRQRIQAFGSHHDDDNDNDGLREPLSKRESTWCDRLLSLMILDHGMQERWSEAHSSRLHDFVRFLLEYLPSSQAQLDKLMASVRDMPCWPETKIALDFHRLVKCDHHESSEKDLLDLIAKIRSCLGSNEPSDTSKESSPCTPKQVELWKKVLLFSSCISQCLHHERSLGNR